MAILSHLDFILVALAAGGAALLTWSGLQAPRRIALPRASVAPPDGCVFLFDGERAVDATGPARNLIAHHAMDVTDRAALTALLSGHFPDLHALIDDLPDGCRKRLTSESEVALIADLENSDGQCRVTLTGEGITDPAPRNKQGLKNAWV